MTTLALLNEPRCLDLGSFALMPPRPIPEPGTKSHRGWDALNVAHGTARFRDEAARECLDTVAVLRSYRQPLPGEVWTLPLGAERRMLAQVNAILALGRPALERVAELGIDADLPDPGRAFASLFVLGCAAGPAWREPMLALFVAAVRRNPAEGAAAIEAMSLAPNTEVLDGVSRLLASEHPKLRAAAVRVLAFRAALSPQQWVAATLDDDESVALAAACAPVAGIDRERCRAALERLLHHRSEGLVRAALRAGLGLRLEAAHRRAGEIARSNPGWADALQCLAMFGRRSDEDTIRAVMAGPQWLSGVRAAALAGRVGLVPDLLLLSPPDDAAPAQREEIPRALSVITGLPFGAVENRATADRLWARHRDRFVPRHRYRHGQFFHPAVLLRSLKLDAAEQVDPRWHLRESRQQAYLELVSATEGRVPRFSAYDFVARQRVGLQRIDAWLIELIDAGWVAGPLL